MVMLDNSSLSSANDASMAMLDNSSLSSANDASMAMLDNSSLSSANDASMAMLHNSSLSSAMNARTIGSGDQTMVLAHGFGGDQSVWDKTLVLLAQNCKVVVFDWVFSGAVEDQTLYDPVKYSSVDVFADDLIYLLDDLNVKSSIYVGHSVAGIIGCIASTKRPDLFQRLVLLNASPRYINTEDYKGGYETADISIILSSIESDFQNWAAYFASIVVDSKDPLSVQTFENLLKKMNVDTALSMAKLVFNLDKRDILENVCVPCTIIQSSNDIVVPKTVAYYMQEKIEGKSTVEMIDCIGHFPQLTEHLQLLNLLKAVLVIDVLI